MEIHQTSAIAGEPDCATWREFLRAETMSAGVYLIPAAARAPHRFHSVEEDLRLLVLFAPPEGSR